MNIVDRILRMAFALGFSGAEVCVSRQNIGGSDWYVAVRSSGQPILASESGATIDEALRKVDATIAKMTSQRYDAAAKEAKKYADAMAGSESSSAAGGSDGQ